MIYLVHFERPYKHARHYLGYTSGSLSARFERHISLAPLRRGSALMRAVLGADIKFKVVRTWPGGRKAERRKHNGGHAVRCPVCRGQVAYNEATCLLAVEGTSDA